MPKRNALRELALVGAVTFVYFLTRGLLTGRTDDALLHARDILAFEQSLHLAPEAAIQAIGLAHPWMLEAANLFYLGAHLPLLLAVAIWLYRSHPAAYHGFRLAFAVSALVGLSIYAVLPVAPPRFLPGFVDTLQTSGIDLDGSAVGLFYNPYAAMPSLHVAWAVIAGRALMSSGRLVVLRVIGLILPAVMVLVVVVTGNHYLLDAAAGILVAVFSLTCSVLGISWRKAAAKDRHIPREVAHAVRTH